MWPTREVIAIVGTTINISIVILCQLWEDGVKKKHTLCKLTNILTIMDDPLSAFVLIDLDYLLREINLMLKDELY